MQAMKSLGRIRAEKTGSATSWSPIEMLEDLLREARAGEVDLREAVIIFGDGTEGKVTIRRAGVSAGNEFIMIRTAMRRVCELED